MSSRDPPRVSSEGSRVTLWVVTDLARPADRKPAPLARGDGVAIVAPASPFERERFERGLAALWKIGLEPRFSEGLFAKHPPESGHLAGDDERRIEELRIAFTDPSAKALVLARGGYGALRLRLGTQEVPEKLIVGYSDATVLHELWARAGVPSIHGPMCTQLGEEPSALGRLEALWRAWESLRLDPMLGMGTWYRDHLDHQLPILTSAAGPFADCDPTRHFPPETDRLTHTPAPIDWWAPAG